MGAEPHRRWEMAANDELTRESDPEELRARLAQSEESVHLLLRQVARLEKDAAVANVQFRDLESTLVEKSARVAAEIERRTEAEGALQWSLDEIQDLYDQAPCGYYTLDPSGQIARINQTALEWLGYQRDEVLGRPFSELIKAGCLARYADAMQFHGVERITDLELEIVAKSGRILSVLLGACAVRDARGEVRMYRATFLDITARKQAEAELERTHRLLEALSETSTDAMFVKDLSGKYLFINSAGARFLGRPVSEVLGRDDCDVFPAESAARIMAVDRGVMEDNQVHNQVEIVVTGGKTRRFHSMKGPLRDASGRVIGLIGIARDMTDEPQSG